jgi:myosin V
MNRRRGGSPSPGRRQLGVVPTGASRDRAVSTSSENRQGRSYVWVRTDVVEAIWGNHGTLPKGWKPSRKRGRNDAWGWTRAYVVQSSTKSASCTSTDRRPSGLSYRTKAAASHQSAVLVTLTVDDDEFAPQHLQGATVSLSYNPNDTDTVCSANGWWMHPETWNEPPQDLTTLTHLHEPAVVYCLQQHFRRDNIYTYTGKVLLAINPFRPLEGMYGEDVMARYNIDGVNHTAGSNGSRAPPPHVYAVAQDAYRAVMDQGDNQTILVSGESGSGKTVTVKVVMGYLANQSRRTCNSYSSVPHGSHIHEGRQVLGDGSTPSGEGIESRILSSNPILESFGNARTVRNDNSSRFGKFLQLYFTPSAGALVSASLETYLLEKVRIVVQAPGERNFHIFYELLAGLSQEERRGLKIENETARDFRLTSSSGTFTRRDGVDDRESFKDLQQAWDTIGVTPTEQTDIYGVLCALLHLSNVSFVMKETTEECELQASQSLEDAVYLLGVSPQSLNNAFCVCEIKARGEIFHKKLTVQQANKAREAFIKATYEAVFKFIVDFVNESIDPKIATDISREDLPRIGILDIFGFECFTVNSFEQLCINYCNEALQQQFNRFMFKVEQQEYDEEGIDWSFIEFPDNQDVLDLLEKRRDGIFEILDENCKLSSCTDTSFLRAVIEKCEMHERFSSSPSERANVTFAIKHYLGRVAYCSESFLEKNKDELPKETKGLLASSSRSFMARMGDLLMSKGQSGYHVSITSIEATRPEDACNTSSMTNLKSRVQRNQVSSFLRETVSSQFRIQLNQLRLRIEATTPHYVRCLKPNEALLSKRFDASMIADQLRCAGVLEAIRVSRIGFPHKFYHEEFLERYYILTNDKLKDVDRGKRSCILLISSLKPQIMRAVINNEGTHEESSSFVSRGMQVGLCKVFLRSSLFRAIELLRTEKLGKSARLIQKHVRRNQASLRFRRIRRAAGAIQCFVRRMKVEQNVRIRSRHSAASKIQATWRKFLAETELMAAMLIAHFCQAYWRGLVARRLYMASLFEHHAINVQRCWRRWKAVGAYKRFLHSIIKIQCFLRRSDAKKILKERMRSARTLDFIAEDRNKYREEAARLRAEVQRLRLLSEPSMHNSSSGEIERLRSEVSRLQNLLSLNRLRPLDPVVLPQDYQGDYESIHLGSPNRANKAMPVDSPHSRSPFGMCSQKWNKGHARGRNDSSPPAVVSLSDTASSPNVSLLDMDRDFETAPVSQDSAHRVVLLDDGSIMVNELPPRNRQAQPRMTGSLSLESDEVDRGHRMGRIPFEDIDQALMQLHMQIAEGKPWQVSDLANQGIEILDLVNRPNSEGKSALHLAAEFDNLLAALQLTELGAVANIQDFLGNTPLHLAKGVQMIEVLLKKGIANPNIPNVDGNCALHVHVERRDVGAVRLLLMSGAKANSADHLNWFTPLHLAVLCRDQPPSKSNNESMEGNTPLVVELLCKNAMDLDVNYQDRHGNTALHYAVQEMTSDSLAMIDILLKNGAEPNLPNNRNQQPLLLLCHNNELRKKGIFENCLQALLNHGAKTNAQSNTGCTPLHLCLYHGDFHSAATLIRHSAELHLLWKKVRMQLIGESHWCGCL